MFIEKETPETLDVIVIWKNQLDELWQQFKEEDEKIKNQRLTNTYFEQYFSAIECYYKSINIIEKKRIDFSKKQESDTKYALMLTLQQKYSFLLKKLDAQCDRIMQTIEQFHTYEISCKRSDIANEYDKLKAIGMQRIALGDGEEKILSEEIKIDETVTAALRLLHKKQKPEDDRKTDPNDQKLPELNIIPFDGRFEKWQEFRDSFLEAVHKRSDITDANKLQHLKGVLRGDPQQSILNFTLANENYIAAWNMLNERYNNDFQQLSSYIRVLMVLPECYSVDELRRLRIKATSSITALRNLQQPVDSWDGWLVFVVSQKLDRESRRMWMEQVASGSGLPTWTQLYQFIECRIQTSDAEKLFSLASTRPQTPTSDINDEK